MGRSPDTPSHLGQSLGGISLAEGEVMGEGLNLDTWWDEPEYRLREENNGSRENSKDNRAP